MKENLVDKSPGPEGLLLTIGEDKANQALWRYSPSFTEFLDPGQRAILKKYNHLWEADMFSFGGYEDAERQIAVFTPHNYIDEVVFPIKALQIFASQSFGKLSHGDYLGSILGLGIERDRVGDILLNPEGCQVLVHETVATYILDNLEKVARIGIKTEMIDLSSIKPAQRKTSSRESTVASLRLDSILAVAYKISRSKAANYIKSGRVKHNFLEEIRPDREVKEGDVLSLSGYGRAELKEIGNLSKKGRFFIKTERLL